MEETNQSISVRIKAIINTYKIIVSQKEILHLIKMN